MDPSARFAALMARPEHEVGLDEVALLIAAHANPRLRVPDEQARLDVLADALPVPTAEGVMVHLFADLGFRGNRDDYYDPNNSYLDVVLRRRVGIPISLGVVAVEVGRRRDVALHMIGMPGHVLVGSGGPVWWDPFAGGERLDVDGCERLFHRVAGPAAAFDLAMLAPIGPFAVAARMLANLQQVHTSRKDRTSLIWVLRLRLLVPGVAIGERRVLASALAADGRFGEAAAELDVLTEQAADAGDDDLATEAAQGATRLRARLN